MSISELKLKAKKIIGGNNWASILLALIIVGLINGAAGATAILTLLTMPLILGTLMYIQGIAQGKAVGYDILFAPYKNINRCVNFVLMYILMGIFTFLWSLLFFIPGIIKAYSYSAAPYIMLYDENIGPMEALEKSKQLMHGNKARRFVLDLSFLGWAILSCLTFGILLIWVMPYMNTTQYCFYEDILEPVYHKNEATPSTDEVTGTVE